MIMKNFQNLKDSYFLDESVKFFDEKAEKRLRFLESKNFLFNEISEFINNCIPYSKKISVFCAGNSIISKKLQTDKILVKEISNKYKINYNNNLIYKDKIDKEDLYDSDAILIADIEHQSNPAGNLLNLSKNMNDDARLIILSKNLVWMFILKILKIFITFSPTKNNFLPTNYLENLYSSCELEIVRRERLIAIPVNIPIVTNFLNKIFRLPVLNLLCVSNITILKRIKVKEKILNKKNISFIIPCKNEENNITLIKNQILISNQKYEFIFGDDQSDDNTISEIKKLSEELNNYNINYYDGPGICKSENVYKGINISEGEIIVIYDADLTVSFNDIEFAINILENTNADFINCTRMIYPQKDKAMKPLNFFGNIFFAFLFSLLFRKKITDTLCGTKIFYKKDWDKIKEDNGKWGVRDLWGDFDLLIGAYKNNLKITEVPITYHERVEGKTKMTSLFSNTSRMIWIVIAAFYKLRLKK